MKRPEKKKRNDYVDTSEGNCQQVGISCYNQACEEWERYHKDEINRLTKNLKEPLHQDIQAQADFDAEQLTDYMEKYGKLQNELSTLKSNASVENLYSLCVNYLDIDWLKQRYEDSGLPSDKAIFEERISQAENLAKAIHKRLGGK